MAAYDKEQNFSFHVGGIYRRDILSENEDTRRRGLGVWLKFDYLRQCEPIP